MPGSPIRTPWDHSSVDSSPRPIAASHVLHRLLVPRHPPSALDNLTTKMLASTMQFSTNNPPPPHTHHLPPHTPTGTHEDGLMDTAVPGKKTHQKKQPHPQQGTHPPQEGRTGCSLRTQQDASTPPAAPHPPPHPPQQGSSTRNVAVADDELASLSDHEHPTKPHAWCRPHTVFQRMALLRKEVIQPHLPVRLPCYDFVPIASPTFDGSLPPRGWATGFGCCRLS